MMQSRFPTLNVATARLATFRRVVLHSAQGSVDARVVIAFEADGLYLTVEELRLGMRDIAVSAAPGHGSRIALLLHTSGTTGLPKASPVSHLRVISGGIMFAVRTEQELWRACPPRIAFPRTTNP